MLLNLGKKNWTDGLKVTEPSRHSASNESLMGELLDFTKQYNKRLSEEEGKTAEELVLMNVGKLDPKKHLEQTVETLLTNNIAQTLGIMVDSIIF